MTEELKALSCPFCGGRSHHILGARQIRMLDVVKCLDCFAEIQGNYEPESALSKWNTRAQLPSQGGEAVAEYQQLSRYNNWDRIDKEAFDLGKLGSCPERFRALCTRPADQVADGVVVSRELLERAAHWLEMHSSGGGSTEGFCAEELHTLLEQKP